MWVSGQAKQIKTSKARLEADQPCKTEEKGGGRQREPARAEG